MYRTLFVFFALFMGVAVAAQRGVTVSAKADRNKILIGEHIRLVLKADTPEDEAIGFFSVDSIPHFDIIEKGKIDTSNTSSGTLLTQVIRLTSFDSGHFVIPPFVLPLDSLATDSIPVDVSYSSFDPNQPYHDIKDVIDVEVKKEIPWWWYAVGGGILLALFVLIYWLTHRKKAPVVATAAKANPFETAMDKLNELKRNKPAAKEYYSRMIDIFREYLFDKRGINSLQETTDDLVQQLRQLEMRKENFDQLSQAMRLGDFVKFAKYLPVSEEDDTVLNTIKKSIEEIEQLN